MATGLRLPVYALLAGSLATLFVYWESSLLLPQTLLIAGFSLYSVSNYVIARPQAGLKRKFAVCLVLTFADIVYTSMVLRMPLAEEFFYWVGEFVLIFIVLQRIHPHDKVSELSSPLFRGVIYLATGFFMAVGVAQGLEYALQGGGLTPLTVGHAAVVVVGKQILTTLVYLADEFFCDPKPVREIEISELIFNAKAGVVIFALLCLVWQLAPKTHPDFTWCAFVSNVVYQLWGAFDTISHHKYYNKIGFSD